MEYNQAKYERTNFTDHTLYQQILLGFEYAKKHRDPQLPVWREAENMIYGDHWKGSKMASHKSKVVDNHVQEAIEKEIPIVTARSPKVDVTPEPVLELKNEEFMKAVLAYCKGLEDEFDDSWKYNKMQRKNRETFRNMKGYGNGGLKSVKVPGKDKIQTTVLDIFTIFPHPGDNEITMDMKHPFYHAPIMDVKDIKDSWDVDVKPEGTLDSFRAFQFDKHVEQADADYLTPVGDTENERLDILERGTAEERAMVEGQALVIECWYPADEDDVEYDAAGTGKVVGSVGKYPNGRITIIARNEPDKILFDGPNPYNRIPFFFEKNQSESHSFWGRPLYWQIKTLNKAKNMILSQLTDNIRLIGNPKTWRVVNWFVKKLPFTNQPGEVVDVKRPNAFGFVTPPNMPASAERILMYIDNRIQSLLGVFDSFAGKASSASSSGKKEETLAAQTAMQLRPDVEEMVEMIQELADHQNYIIQNMYKERKYHNRPNPDTQKLEPIPFVGHSVLDKSGKVFKKAGDMIFKVAIAIGSMLPRNMQAEFEQTIFLFERGAAGIDHLIDAAPDIRNKAALKEWYAEQLANLEEDKQAENQGIDFTPEEQEILQGTDEDAILQTLLARAGVSQQQQPGA